MTKRSSEVKQVPPPKLVDNPELPTTFVNECVQIGMVNGTITFAFAELRHVEGPPQRAEKRVMVRIAMPTSDVNRFIEKLRVFASTTQIMSSPDTKMN